MYSIKIDDLNSVFAVKNCNKLYVGVGEIKKYFNLNTNATTNAEESKRYKQLMPDDTVHKNKLFATHTGLVIMLESNNIHYSQYHLLFDLINNTIDNFNKIEMTLQQIDKNIKVIQRTITIDPFET